MQRLLSSERLLSSAPQPAVVVDTVNSKGNKKSDDQKRSSKISTPYRTSENDPVNTFKKLPLNALEIELTHLFLIIFPEKPQRTTFITFLYSARRRKWNTLQAWWFA